MRNKKYQTNREDQQEKDLEFSCTGEGYSLIPPDDYQVVFVKAVPLHQWRGQKIILWFRVVEFGDWFGKEIFLACNGSNGTISPRSKFYRNWVIAAGRKPDRSRMKRMTTLVFRGKVFLARVRTVTHDQQNLPLPSELQYSKIEGLLKRLTDAE